MSFIDCHCFQHLINSRNPIWFASSFYNINNVVLVSLREGGYMRRVYASNSG
jgi:hypothetical protein